jgi:hypothetical protein
LRGRGRRRRLDHFLLFFFFLHDIAFDCFLFLFTSLGILRFLLSRNYS